MNTARVPRRELNRQQTWQAIHSAAFELVLRDGLGAATVDAIVERSAVSRRTFFNYFPSKDDAVLGIRAPRLSPFDLEAFESSTEDAFGRVVRLMTAAVRSVFHDLPSFTLERQPLLKRHPELRARLDQHVRDAEELVRDALVARGFIAGGVDDSGRALLMIAGTVMRFAFAPDADGRIDDAPAAIDAAIIRFRLVLKATVTDEPHPTR